jgi:hypothetical protein
MINHLSYFQNLALKKLQAIILTVLFPRHQSWSRPWTWQASHWGRPETPALTIGPATETSRTASNSTPSCHDGHILEWELRPVPEDDPETPVIMRKPARCRNIKKCSTETQPTTKLTGKVAGFFQYQAPIGWPRGLLDKSSPASGAQPRDCDRILSYFVSCCVN